jgi:predicted ribosome quality control (RQC) complex YloA/Tae2 family protein
MFFDALTIAATREELLTKLMPGRVQQVRAVGPLALSLEIYAAHRRHHLLLSAHAEYARVHAVRAAPTRDPGFRAPLLLLLRKYVRGATLQTITQPQFERVLDFGFTKVLPVQKHGPPSLDDIEEEEEEDAGEELDTLDERRAEIPPGFALYETHLIAEIMGRHSNIVLVGADGAVLDAIKHIPSSINRYRTTLPHQPYVPPPLQRKLDFLSMGTQSFANELAGLTPQMPLWQALVARFRAVSPLLAREAVYRGTGGADTPVAEANALQVYAALADILGLARTHAWQPTLAWDGEEPLAFAPYPLEHLAGTGGRVETTGTISEAAEAFYAAVEQVAGHAQLRAEIRAELEERRRRLERRRASLQGELDRAAGFEAQRHQGELILAYMYSLAPGQTRLEIPEENLVITLDPNRTPLEQAQAMFREYQRARAAVEGVPARIEAAGLGLRYFDELATHLDLAEDYDTIQTIRREVAALPEDPGAWGQPPPPKPDTRPAKGHGKPGKGKIQRPKSQPEAPKSGGPARMTTEDGFTIFYGRSARQNDTLTFDLARPEDLWLHARGAPGAHVVIRTGGRPVPERAIAEAARLAARHSKARDESAVDVIITEKRHVRRIPGAPPGLVTVSNERVLRVRPTAADQ